jgi:hypothetical protein
MLTGTVASVLYGYCAEKAAFEMRPATETATCVCVCMCVCVCVCVCVCMYIYYYFCYCAEKAAVEMLLARETDPCVCARACVCVCVRVCIVYIYMVFSWRVIKDNKSMIFMSVCPGGQEKNNICISTALERDRRETRLIYNIIHTHTLYIYTYIYIYI